MMAVPAKLAGCNNVYLATPPDSSGNINPAIVFAAMISGVDAIFKVGGAQAVAAFAYGTETVPQVNKIFGPGNQYVTLAKQMVNAEGVAIDMPAGPSEVLVVADSATPADYVAADLLAQAEHGADSQVLFLTEEEEMLEKVNESVKGLMNELPRKDLVEKSLESSKLILLENKEKIMEMVNEYAPEHLILACENADELAEKVINAGSVFMGQYTPESLGDYSSGTNHVLPTGGAAKGYSGVNIDSFLKKITFQKAEKSGLENMGEVTMIMADKEELQAHKLAVEIRLATKKQLL
jgi:histidinol dehydrogenase